MRRRRSSASLSKFTRSDFVVVELHSPTGLNTGYSEEATRWQYCLSILTYLTFVHCLKVWQICLCFVFCVLFYFFFMNYCIVLKIESRNKHDLLGATRGSERIAYQHLTLVIS